MDISRVDTLIGLFGLFPIVATFAIFAVRSPLGAVSLPCMTILTSFTYFYLMPVVALAGGDTGFFGMYISDMLWMHFAVLLYNLGAIGAFLVHARTLNANPEPAYPWDVPSTMGVFRAVGSCDRRRRNAGSDRKAQHHGRRGLPDGGRRGDQ